MRIEFSPFLRLTSSLSAPSNSGPELSSTSTPLTSTLTEPLPRTLKTNESFIFRFRKPSQVELNGPSPIKGLGLLPSGT